jgi:DNA-binding transcriptional LysR family regulator
MDHLKAMRTFVRIIEEGGFASAARALNVAPAVVTRALAELETHLGTRLIHRTTRRLALTEIGEQYLERTRTILADLASAEDLVSSAHSEPSGTLRLRTPAAFAIHQLAKHLPDFHRQFPKVNVEVCTLSAVEDVDEGHDLTILWRHRPLDGDFVARRLATTEVILCAAPEYLDLHGRPEHPSELSQHKMLLQPIPSSRDDELTFRRRGLVGGVQRDEQVGVRPKLRAAVTTMNAELTYASALSGLGICGLPSFVVEDAILESVLERVLPEWQLHQYTIWVCMPTRKHVPARTRAMLDFLVATFGGQDRDPWVALAHCVAPVSRTPASPTVQ